MDLAETAPIAGATILHADVHDPAALTAIRAELGGLADLVLSDMAPSTTGHAATDHLRIVALAEAAFAVAGGILEPGRRLCRQSVPGWRRGRAARAAKTASSPSCATPSRRRAAPSRRRLTSSRRGFAAASRPLGNRLRRPRFQKATSTRPARVSNFWPICVVPAAFNLSIMVYWNCISNRTQSFGYQLSAAPKICW